MNHSHLPKSTLSKPKPGARRQSKQSESAFAWLVQSDYRAWIGSTAFHTFLLVLVALFFKPVPNGIGEQVGERIGMELAHNLSAGEDAEPEGGVGGDGNAEAANATAELLRTLAPESTADLDASMDNNLGSSLASALSGINVSGDQASGVGDSDLGGPGGSGDGGGSGSGHGVGKSKTSFMGIEGEGSSFVYVVDYSASMREYEGRPMRRAKSEMANSIQSLTRVNQFQIIFYNDTPSRYSGSLGSAGRLIFANDTEKEAAEDYVRGIMPIGGTEHYGALLNGLEMRPDVLFFLTDAADPDLSQDQVERVVAYAERNRTTIHAVQFGVGTNSGAGHWIEQLARRTRGKFRYIDVSSTSFN